MDRLWVRAERLCFRWEWLLGRGVRGRLRRRDALPTVDGA